MTRINMVDPADLSDQHLRAELRELPRVFSSKINISDAPERYCLGKGHVKWAKSYPYFIGFRYMDLYKEAMFRGFNVSYKPEDLWRKFQSSYQDNPQPFRDTYIMSTVDIAVSMLRIRERYLDNPDFHKWTKRDKPIWILMPDDEFKKFIIPFLQEKIDAKGVLCGMDVLLGGSDD